MKWGRERVVPAIVLRVSPDCNAAKRQQQTTPSWRQESTSSQGGQVGKQARKTDRETGWETSQAKIHSPGLIDGSRQQRLRKLTEANSRHPAIPKNFAGHSSPPSAARHHCHTPPVCLSNAAMPRSKPMKLPANAQPSKPR
ncbi:hypothetical protein E2320_002253 [Naja naja]|nr:hypothetical protein E2320_002253 [Naja naja]